jgi:3-dehydroquinate synthase
MHYIGHFILEDEKLINLCQKWGSQTVVIVDSKLTHLYGRKLAQRLDAELLPIPSGEKCKTRKTKEKIEDHLLKKGYGKDTVLIALGGGATTDLVGFIASTYLRGVPLILIPTTLLGMVDASIGGKTAINTPMGKNLIGSFYEPKAVFCDLGFLKTLSLKKWMHGLAEILKIGLTSDVTLWNMAKENIKDERLISLAIAKKIEIVKEDPFEKGIRRTLNFGHTIGHALETASLYKIPHGDAVFLGCIAESYLSYFLGFLKKSDWEQIHHFYQTLTPIKWPHHSTDAFFEALFFDKKKEKGETRFVLLNTPGQAASFDGNYCKSVQVNAIQQTFSWMKEHYG